MSEPQYRSVLRYPGSKWGIAEKIVELIPKHHSYLEPYFGSGAVYFKKEPSAIETINDLDNDVITLFECLKHDPEKLASRIYATPFSREIYDRQFQNRMTDDPYEKSLSFLIKCWQGHGFRTNGYKVGWKNDIQGRERMYSLLNWTRLPGWCLDVCERLRYTQIENMPALELIKKFNHKNVCMYIDPPYVLSTRNGKQYQHEMSDEDHAELLEILDSSEAQILISGYESRLYEDKLKNWNKTSFSGRAEGGRVTKEILWTNFTIQQEEQMTLSL